MKPLPVSLLLLAIPLLPAPRLKRAHRIGGQPTR